jgi:hypothetical protein
MRPLAPKGRGLVPTCPNIESSLSIRTCFFTIFFSSLQKLLVTPPCNKAASNSDAAESPRGLGLTSTCSKSQQLLPPTGSGPIRKPGRCLSCHRWCHSTRLLAGKVGGSITLPTFALIETCKSPSRVSGLIRPRFMDPWTTASDREGCGARHDSVLPRLEETFCRDQGQGELGGPPPFQRHGEGRGVGVFAILVLASRSVEMHSIAGERHHAPDWPQWSLICVQIRGHEGGGWKPRADPASSIDRQREYRIIFIRTFLKSAASTGHGARLRRHAG